jgi:hypothetical protein
MAVILLFVLIQTYRFATISSMTIGVAKLAKRGLMILTINCQQILLSIGLAIR